VKRHRESAVARGIGPERLGVKVNGQLVVAFRYPPKDAKVVGARRKGREAVKTFEEQSAEMNTPEYKQRLNARRDAWYAEARKQTIETLPAFLAKLGDVEHDYNTIGVAVTAGALAGACAIDHSPHGGITGFQAGWIAWEFWGQWLHDDKPKRMMHFDQMLYPQYENHFEKTISPSVWAYLQEQAKGFLGKHEDAIGEVIDHWRSIAAGKVPFGYVVKDNP